MIFRNWFSLAGAVLLQAEHGGLLGVTGDAFDGLPGIDRRSAGAGR
jgi:hypothetical protein